MKNIEDYLGYRFNNPDLLKHALTHSSYAHEHNVKDNEVLEFLGDAVLELIVRDYLVKTYPYLTEGELSKLKAHLVTKSTLANVAKDIHLGEALLLSAGERKNQGWDNDSILCDALEAILAAIYLDGGLKKTYNVLLRLFSPLIERINPDFNKDYKSILQERVQATYKILPKYKILKTAGPDHDLTFEAGLFINNRLFGKGTGKSRKEAERAAAKHALEKFKIPNFKSQIPNNIK